MNDCLNFPHLKGPQDLALPRHDLGGTHALVQVAPKPTKAPFSRGSFWAHVRALTHFYTISYPQPSSQGPQRAPQLLYGTTMDTEAQPGEELVQELKELLRPKSHFSVKSFLQMVN